MTRSPSLSSAPPMTIPGPTGPPSVVGASRTGIDASVIHVSVPAFELRRAAVFCGILYDECHLFALPRVASWKGSLACIPRTISTWSLGERAITAVLANRAGGSGVTGNMSTQLYYNHIVSVSE